jgi:glycosyltransferase involved in cell wall biosynthesis
MIVALHPPDGPATYPAEVRHRIRRDTLEDYSAIAEALNESVVDVVSLQYEPSIFGGDDGSHALAFTGALALPLVTTIHAVPRRPTVGQRKVIAGLAAASDATVVLSAGAASLITKAYGVDASRVAVVPHGVPNLPLVDADSIKPRLGLEGRRVLLSFGLMVPGKGYEAVIDAMPAIAAADPSALYVILGATAPDRIASDGEAYRASLAAQVERLGMGDHVRFVDRFMGRVELATWVEAADVVLAPYLDLDRVTSGTLSYAMGAGRVVVATPFAYAKERLAKNRGVLVAPGSADDLAAAVLRLLGDRTLREAYGARAYADTRGQVWSAIGAEYGRIFGQVARPSARPGAPVRRMASTGR